MNEERKRKYIIETKKVPIKTNKTSSVIQYKSSEKTYTEDEVKELIRDVLKGVTYEINK